MQTIEANKSQDFSNIFHTLSKDSSGSPVKFKLGESGFYIDLFRKVITKNNLTNPADSIRIPGGILADDTGSGKTITCLALIHSSPFGERDAERRKFSNFGCLPIRVPSSATCVVCPSNLFAQLISEAKRCNPNFKIVSISCIRDYQKVSWKDVVLADLVVISYQFLTNTNYLTHIANIHDFIYSRDSFNLDVKGSVKLSMIRFYRIIFDEFHEMGHLTNKCQNFAKNLWADFCWGITGTPKFGNSNDIVEVFPYLNIAESWAGAFRDNQMTQHEFMSKFVKRNVPDLKLPPMIHEVVWVEFSPSERALIAALPRNTSVADEIMSCNHY